MSIRIQDATLTKNVIIPMWLASNVAIPLVSTVVKTGYLTQTLFNETKPARNPHSATTTISDTNIKRPL